MFSYFKLNVKQKKIKQKHRIRWYFIKNGTLKNVSHFYKCKFL